MGAEHAATLEVSPEERSPKPLIKKIKKTIFIIFIYLFIYDFI